MCSIKTAALVGLVLMIMVGSMQLVTAGVEPSPFIPEINQLSAVVNMLESINHKLSKIMDKPPIEGESAHNINGALNKIEGIDDRIQSVGSMADSIFADIAAVMGIDPSPFNDPDLINAFEAVRSAVLQVADTIARELPTNVALDFIDTLGIVGYTVQTLSGEVEGYIEQLNNPPPICEPSDKSESSCTAFANCTWDDENNTCCCFCLPPCDQAGV